MFPPETPLPEHSFQSSSPFWLGCSFCSRAAIEELLSSVILAILSALVDSHTPTPTLRPPWNLGTLISEPSWRCVSTSLVSGPPITPLQASYPWPLSLSLCKLICHHFICFLSSGLVWGSQLSSRFMRTLSVFLVFASLVVWVRFFKRTCLC